jgi:hypothetical protein
MRFGIASCLLVTTLSVAACHTTAHSEEHAAVLVAPSPATRAQLQAAVSEMLGNANITLADSALTDSSTLSIERARLRDPSGMRIMGRDYEKPQTFRLVLQQSKCVLVHDASGKRATLLNANCKAVPETGRR